MEFTFQSIGVISTPFREKFGVPRQALLADAAFGVLRLNQNFPTDAVKELEKFSHIWLIYPFHKNSGPWHPLIETPRVESKKIGVFATRAPKRPNPIGMSAVRLEGITATKHEVILTLSGVDLLDGTPILDIKPYLPYSDRIAEANSGWITEEITRYPVQFSEASLNTLQQAAERHPHLMELVQQILELDPRPTSQRKSSPIEHAEEEKFAFRILDLDVHWRIRNGAIHVEQIFQQ